jgi:hypothetical protein
MGFILEALIDWHWVGFVKKLSDKYPPWIWVPAMVAPLLLVIGLLILLF